MNRKGIVSMNITKRDVLELRRRLTKKGCSFTRMAGCYVGGSKNIVLKFAQPFLDLEDDVFYKYLEISKKVLSGTPGGNLLELSFAKNEDAAACQQLLGAVRESELKNDGMLDRLYEQIIAQYDSAGNYLILLFHDIYDVPARASDGTKLDESEEVYSYLIGAICPVELSKPGIGYHEEEGCFGPRVRDWVVSLPELGFVYPAFSGGSSDVSAALYYVKTGKESHPEVMQRVLGCIPQRTAGEEKSCFQSIVSEAFGSEQEDAENAMLSIQKNLSELIAVRDADDLPPIEMTAEAVQDILSDTPMPEPVKERIVKTYAATFEGALPPAQNLLDNKLVAASMQREQTLTLTRKIESLEQQLADKETTEEKDDLPWDETAPAIVLQVSKDKAKQIQSQVIDGQRCLVIPLADGDGARINGAPAAF